jgi:hypothetical protein
MKQNESLSLYFLIYAVVEITITIVAANLLTRGIDIMVLAIVLQLGGQIGITIEGLKNERYNTYRLYMGAVIPFILLSLMIWYNTF